MSKTQVLYVRGIKAENVKFLNRLAESNPDGQKRVKHVLNKILDSARSSHRETRSRQLPNHRRK